MGKNKNNLRVNVYAVLARAVEEGSEYGWNRAHKHTETPSKDLILEYIHTEIMNNICEYFDFKEIK